ncbi:MAG TPA: ankyrin repeat domain-containing protein, partial [Stellaceae bacterium]|nr:ankyrin repeat domain-containing protein [Stellaceae bacterium]
MEEPSKEEKLYQAASRGDTQAVKALLDAGANVDAYGLYGVPLQAAAGNGHTETVRALLDAGAQVQINDNAALRVAAAGGHTEIVQALLSGGADIHAGEDVALYHAVMLGHAETAIVLIEAGADVHVVNDFPLRRAAYRGDTGLVQALLDCGADPRAEDDDALRHAILNGHHETVAALHRFQAATTDARTPAQERAAMRRLPLPAYAADKHGYEVTWFSTLGPDKSRDTVPDPDDRRAFLSRGDDLFLATRAEDGAWSYRWPNLENEINRGASDYGDILDFEIHRGARTLSNARAQVRPELERVERERGRLDPQPQHDPAPEPKDATEQLARDERRLIGAAWAGDTGAV